MIDMKSLLPEVAKLLPGVPPQELIAGIQQFAQKHPNLNNQQALQALMQYLQSQKKPVPAAPPFQNLISQLGAH